MISSLCSPFVARIEKLDAGPDAAPFLAWRAAMTDEEWTEFTTLGAEAFRARVKKDFGLELKLPGEATRAAG